MCSDWTRSFWSFLQSEGTVLRYRTQRETRGTEAQEREEVSGCRWDRVGLLLIWSLVWASSQPHSCLLLSGSWHHIVTEIESSEGGWDGMTLSAHSLLVMEMPVCSVLTMLYRSASGFGFLPLPRMALGCLSFLSSLPLFLSYNLPPPHHHHHSLIQMEILWPQVKKELEGTSLLSWSLLPLHQAASGTSSCGE